MIKLEANPYNAKARVLKGGRDAGMVERGVAYVQGLTPAELRELADRMEEART